MAETAKISLRRWVFERLDPSARPGGLSLANKVLTAEYRTALPDEKRLAEELDKTRRELEARRLGLGGEAEGEA